MFVYCGDVRQCECGIPTGIADANDCELFTGDIVVVFTERDGQLSCGPDTLTVMVEQRYRNIAGEDPVPIHGPLKAFAMGIKDACDQGRTSGNPWRILRVKRYDEVVDGERWKDFGFNYRAPELFS